MFEWIAKTGMTLLDTGIEAGEEALRRKLEDAFCKGYANGQIAAASEAFTAMLEKTSEEIKKRKRALLEENFYQAPSPDAVIEMKAYDFLLEHLEDIMCHTTSESEVYPRAWEKKTG